ncbi:DinB family protein [Pedobacter caeni]|uniref:DinB superfamily protein n=1 Tax=Pedobacter caeni TaxID=288992 RepID=A0A1M5N7E0_9SPHI|nr:DinB family protein [Pedobacter caeni]SHG84933.1 DinB superfamily protein [Pedobacter caeni]
MIDFAKELRKAYDGDAWHGNNISTVVASVKVAQAFTHPIPDAHSIAELVLHLSSWTEEVISRLSGNLPKEPLKGDWPVPAHQTDEYWEVIVNDFDRINEDLLALVNQFSEEQWSAELFTGPMPTRTLSHFELLNGLIQHHAYHAGQIALLSKFKNHE